MPLSADQLDILERISAPLSENHRLQAGGHLINVPAVAGSGKSMLITALSRRLADQRILFLSHGRNVADRGRATLPANVTVRTVYEMAARHVKATHTDKMDAGGVRGFLTDQAMRDACTNATRQDLPLARRVLKHFYTSANRFPEPSNLPDGGKDETPEQARMNKQALQVARAVWFSQTYRETTSAPLTFDAVVKLWTQSTSEPIYFKELDKTLTLPPLGHHDIVIVEESQDASEAFLDFLSRQSMSVILFGDPFQSLRRGNWKIQQFRHPMHQRADTAFMGESWRFGPAIASLLNALTLKAGSKHENRIVGLGRSNVYGEEQRYQWEQQGLHYTEIAASPATLFEQALIATSRGKTVAWVDGLDSYPITLLRDLAALATPYDRFLHDRPPTSQITTDWVAACDSLEAAEARCQSRYDNEGLALCRFVRTHAGEDLLGLIDGWRQADAERQRIMLQQWTDPPERDVTMTTVTRSKGHEFPRVSIAQDVIPPSLLQQWPIKSTHQHLLNIAYTAISRAQYEVAIPADLQTHLKMNNRSLAENSFADPSEIPATDVVHPYFGIQRQALLEMHPRQRHKRMTMKAPKTPSNIESGQTRTREQLEAEAQALSMHSTEELRAMLPGRTGRNARKRQ